MRYRQLIIHSFFWFLVFIAQSAINTWLGAWGSWPFFLIVTIFISLCWSTSTALIWALPAALFMDSQQAGWFGLHLISWSATLWLINWLVVRWLTKLSLYTFWIVGILGAIFEYWFVYLLLFLNTQTNYLPTLDNVLTGHLTIILTAVVTMTGAYLFLHQLTQRWRSYFLTS